MNDTLSISVVLYKNSIQQLQQLLSCVLRTTLFYKIYFIDNSPSDKLRNELKEFIENKELEYIFTGKNLGYGAAHNIAIRKVLQKNKYHLVLNPDVKFGKGILEELYNYMELNNNVGVVLPKVLYPNGNLQYVCKLLPTPFNLISRLFPNTLFPKYNQQFELHFSGHNKIMNIPYLQGCFLLLRTKALEKVGLFDERFFMYPEDIDLTRRLHKRYATIYYPYVVIFHEHAKASFKNWRMFIIHAYNIIKYFNKWGWFFDTERKRINNSVLQQLRQSE
ncbi:MAG: glycosyltransferase family 2 protein [Parafilimonas sp.]